MTGGERVDELGEHPMRGKDEAGDGLRVSSDEKRTVPGFTAG
jgi:hypothetical protein